MSYFRKNIDAMTAYVPGEQPAPGAKLIKLNTNENPYPPSLKAIRVLRGLTADGLRPYPDPTAGEFRLAVSEVLGVPADWVLPGNGSDDVITMIARACLAPGRKAVYPAPTFEFYPTQGRIEGAELVEVPFDDDFNLPVEQLLAAGGAVTFVASPNSPSGTSAPNEQLEQLAAGLDGVLVIDEAYVDFADNNALELVRRFDNVIVLRTLSKGYSLAGLRLGFGVACPSLLSGFLKTKAIYNVSAPAAAVGAAAMRDQDHKNACVEKIKASRVKLTGELEAMGFRIWPSQSNFLLIRPPEGDAARLYEALRKNGILVRYFNQPGLRDKLRVTIGTDRQNAALIDAARGLVGA